MRKTGPNAVRYKRRMTTTTMAKAANTSITRLVRLGRTL
jgi:hypothetical protein